MKKNHEPKRDNMFCVVADGYLGMGQGLMELFGRLGRNIQVGAAIACASLALILTGTFL